MEIFINELSLESQYYSREEFQTAILNFIGLFKVLRENNSQNQFYKDKLFTDRRYAVKNEHFKASFNRLEKDVRDVFRIIFDKHNPRDWQEDQQHSEEIEYLCLGLNCEKVNGTSIAEAAERKLRQPDIAKLLINFTGSRFGKLPYMYLQVLKKCEPEQFADIPFVEDQDGLKKILEDRPIPQDWFLHSPDKFRRTNRIIQGRGVFEEIETGYLWYLDNLHKDHYEVFDRDRKHRGEADLQGKLLSKTRDPKKDNRIDK